MVEVRDDIMDQVAHFSDNRKKKPDNNAQDEEIKRRIKELQEFRGES